MSGGRSRYGTTKTSFVPVRKGLRASPQAVRDPDQVGEVLHPDGLVEPPSGDGLRAQHGVVAVLPEQLCHRVPGGELDGDEGHGDRQPQDDDPGA